MTWYTSAKLRDGYCWTISSAVAPSQKAPTTVSNVTRVPPIRMTPAESVRNGAISVTDDDDMANLRYPHSSRDFHSTGNHLTLVYRRVPAQPTGVCSPA